MTDTGTSAGATSQFTNPEALARLKRRHRAERRFKAYGQAAIGVAVAMLVILILSIGSQALSAFTHHKVTFDLTLTPDVVAPNGVGDTQAIAENVSGFYRLVREDLDATFPEAEASRRLTTQLNGLVTRLAVLPMARQTADHPTRIGETVTYTAALSDDMDLFLKGQVSDQVRLTTGPAREASVLDDGQVRLAGASDAFANLVEQIRNTSAEAAETDSPRSILLQRGTSVLRTYPDRVADAAIEGTVMTGTLEDLLNGPLETRIIELPEAERNVTDRQVAWTLALQEMGRIERRLNWSLLTNADSTYPEIAGVVAALVGSIFTMMITALFAVPVGIAAALYLEEFAPKNRITDTIEVNINNLAAVPSIVFGLLGAAVFLNLFGLPRSAPLVGGLVLGLLTLPTIIIASRAALRSVPPSIRAAALGVGASHTQAVFHHVLPLAAPGILTGSIIGMARALGETAPLLLIGMVAFVAEVPSGPTDEATALPVLIFKWSTGAERAWEPNTAAAIIVLLLFMILMNAVAVLLRRRFERRW